MLQGINCEVPHWSPMYSIFSEIARLFPTTKMDDNQTVSPVVDATDEEKVCESEKLKPSPLSWGMLPIPIHTDNWQQNPKFSLFEVENQSSPFLAVQSMLFSDSIAMCREANMVPTPTVESELCLGELDKLLIL